MKPEVTKLIFNTLTDDQIDDILVGLEKLAKEKHDNVLKYYLSNSNKVDEHFNEDFTEMVYRSSWEDFLPGEYHTLIHIKNERRQEQTG